MNILKWLRDKLLCKKSKEEIIYIEELRKYGVDINGGVVVNTCHDKLKNMR
jgi:hypothetical protein